VAKEVVDTGVATILGGQTLAGYNDAFMQAADTLVSRIAAARACLILGLPINFAWLTDASMLEASRTQSKGGERLQSCIEILQMCTAGDAMTAAMEFASACQRVFPRCPAFQAVS
jgi:hypothetical protein